MYRHLFFDLDHTLWDFDRNSAETIAELYDTLRLADAGVVSAGELSRHFLAINYALWADFDRNLIDQNHIRQHRFPMVFRAMGLPDDPTICTALNDGYLHGLARKPHLMDSARDILDYLAGRYTLHIITNGFSDIQAVKMNSADISQYFTHVVTMETAGFKKPDPRIFQHALTLSGATADESLMLGDSYTADILGAMDAGLDTVFYNPEAKPAPTPPTHDIRHWRELTAIL
jgi:YjjG family noncanonical pyrimidine nucleotidase